MAQTDKQRILEQAAKLYSRPALAEAMNVNGPLLDSWIDGKAPLPDRMLTKLAEALVRLASKPKNP